MTPTTRDPHAQRATLASLGQRIQRRRKAVGATQASLAQALSISEAYVSLIERGGRNPPITTVLAIARALGVSPAQLIE